MKYFERWFTSKSEEQIQKEREIYEQKVFPYGQVQRDKIKQIVDKQCPQDYQEMSLFNYLVVRQNVGEYYDDELKGLTSKGLATLCDSLKKTLRKKYQEDKYFYIALAEYDYGIDENLNYDVEAIKQKALEIKNILENNK